MIICIYIYTGTLCDQPKKKHGLSKMPTSLLPLKIWMRPPKMIAKRFQDVMDDIYVLILVTS